MERKHQKSNLRKQRYYDSEEAESEANQKDSENTANVDGDVPTAREEDDGGDGEQTCSTVSLAGSFGDVDGIDKAPQFYHSDTDILQYQRNR